VGVMAVAAALVRFVLLPLLLPYWLHQRARSFGRLQLVIDDSGIAEKSGLGESLIRWEAVDGWQEDDKGIGLGVRQAMWVYLPHAYLTLEQRRELRARWVEQRRAVEPTAPHPGGGSDTGSAT